MRPIDGKFDLAKDAIRVTSVDGVKVDEVLERLEARRIKPGIYSGRSDEVEWGWEIVVTKSSGADFSFTGFAETPSGRVSLRGTIKASSGALLGGSDQNELIKVDGKYDFEEGGFTLTHRIEGVGARLDGFLKPGKLAKLELFGLVEKTPGRIPGEVGTGDYTISGLQTETSFQVDIIMKPPYEGRARVKHEYSSQLTSTLKPGQIVELTVLSSADKSGSYQPNLAASGFWLVEGDGAEVQSFTKNFIGTASDGKFYASAQCTTRFKVLTKGTIKITAVYTGQVWGPADAWNWNPCTYVYKYKESATQKISSGG